MITFPLRHQCPQHFQDTSPGPVQPPTETGSVHPVELVVAFLTFLTENVATKLKGQTSALVTSSVSPSHHIQQAGAQNYKLVYDPDEVYSSISPSYP